MVEANLSRDAAAFPVLDTLNTAAQKGGNLRGAAQLLDEVFVGGHRSLHGLVWMATLNTMFKHHVNNPCNTSCLYPQIIASMHIQMERLYHAAKELKGIGNQSELARALNQSSQTVNNWEARGISKAGLVKAQTEIGCSAMWLATGEGPMIPGGTNNTVTHAAEDPSWRQNRRSSLPLISWVQAGNWAGAVNEMRREDAEDWIPCPFTHGPHAFILRVAGFSMYNPGGEKSYAPGDFIAVDPEGEIRNKKMVVVRIDDEELATFKQLLIGEDGKMMLQALNPAHNPRVMELPKDSRIVGTVIGKWVPE